MSSQSEPIDLTADDDEVEMTTARHPNSSPQYATPPQIPARHRPPQQLSFVNMHPPVSSPSIFTPNHQAYHPPFAGPSNSSAFFPERHAQQHHQPRPPLPSPSPSFKSSDSASKVIDLTGSTPSPPPSSTTSSSYEDLPPKTPVCMGQLHSQALILHPNPYIITQDLIEEWVPVRLQFENVTTRNPPETIHICQPSFKTPNGEVFHHEPFGFTDQKTAKYLGPMLMKGLIRLDAKVRKGTTQNPVLPLLMMLSTPKGNVPAVGNLLYQQRIFLDHPTHLDDIQSLRNRMYHNPHNPPPGGHNRVQPFVSPVQRWNQPTVSKSVEVQRQIDDWYTNMPTNDDLTETEPAPEICTSLYAHQKRALSFLLQREHEQRGRDGRFPSLWERRDDPLAQQTIWIHSVTRQEVYKEPAESKGSILADDMGLGKTISCISLLASTLESAKRFAAQPLDKVESPSASVDTDIPDASHFEGAVWGMPSLAPPTNAKERAKAQKQQDKFDAAFVRNLRIKVKSRATLIISPLSTIANWEDQLREHWKGEVNVVGGSGSNSCTPGSSGASRPGTPSVNAASSSALKSCRVREGTPLRVYIYHGNARRPEPAFLADFDVVLTTYSTLASEYSKQTRSTNKEEEEEGHSTGVDSDAIEVDEAGNPVIKLPTAKKNGLKRKKPCAPCPHEATSPLQSVHWFRVVLDEAHSIKEIQTVACRASCDLMADRRLCLTGTPVQNKLDDVFALIKFLRLSPLDEKTVWTEWVGSPVKFGQTEGIMRLRVLMECITLRRTKESKTPDGKRILTLPPRSDQLRHLKFEPHEQEIYNQFFDQTKAEFDELAEQNKVMKNYVGILQRILRLRQICDHYELVEGKLGDLQLSGSSYEDLVAAVEKNGLDVARANAIFGILRESALTQCVECGSELSVVNEPQDGDTDVTATPGTKRPRKTKNQSRVATRANSPTIIRTIMTRCQHLYCLQCYQRCVCAGWPQVSSESVRPCSVCQLALAPADAMEIKPELLAGETTATSGARKRPQKREKKYRPPDGTQQETSTKIKVLIKDLLQSSKANPHSQNFDPSSIEVQMVDAHGVEIHEGIKTVVFSQWTSMLDKIEDALDLTGIRYDRLDGTMKRDDRSRAMDALKYDPACEVLLVSLKAGGVGLNLTAAQRVYLMDPYWNPAVENQAVDRIHRLGQTKPVQTVKLIMENSIEDKLLEVQKKKTALANLTLGGTGFSKAEMMQRRKDELTQLFS